MTSSMIGEITHDAEKREQLHLIQNSFFGNTCVPTKAMKLISKINVFDKTKSIEDIVKQFEEALEMGNAEFEPRMTGDEVVSFDLVQKS